MSLEAEVSKLSLQEKEKDDEPEVDANTSTAEKIEEEKKAEEEKEQKEIFIDPRDLSSEEDKLLFAYCDLLDQFQASREQLNKSLATGFFTLAEANRSTRFRYGQTYYHGNMAAARLIKYTDSQFTPMFLEKELNFTKIEFESLKFEDEDTEGVPKQSTTETTETAGSASEETVVQSRDVVKASGTDTKSAVRRKKNKEENGELKEKEAKEVKIEGKDDGQSTSTSEETKAPAPRKRPKAPLNMDPIRWFGILVPHALRTSQREFTDAVVDGVTSLITLQSKMEALEKEIEKLHQIKS
ncbi:hypothetical protein V1511DRAFT_499575 [Dipodascopsis uninucleata]